MTAWIPTLPMNVEWIIIVIAIIYTALSLVLQRKLSNPKKMRQIQAKIQIVQKEMNAMLKQNAPQEQLFAKQKEVMPLMGESMKNSMKPLLVLLPMLLVTYYFIIPSIPAIATNNISGAKELFFIIVFAIGFVGAMIIMVYDRRKMKEEMKEMEAASAPGSEPAPSK
jgi:uncharacterized membrane protein (DUF106 family)